MVTKRVDPKEAQALTAEGWTYLDVRTEAEFDAGHPHLAINVPLNSPDFLAVVQARFKPDAKLVVGCLMGGRSSRACTLLESNGYSQLADQTAGWGGQRDGLGRVVVPGWLELNLPVGGGTRYSEVLKNK